MSEIGGDCFGPRYFCAPSEKYLGPKKKKKKIQNNHRRIHTMTETKMVQVILVIDNSYLDLLNSF